MKSATFMIRRASFFLATLCLLGAVAASAADPQIPKSNVEEMGVTKRIVMPDATAKPDTKGAGAVEKAPCVPSEGSFCFLNGRFEVKVEWLNFSNETGTGHVVDQPVSDNSGVFWFFTDGNWEMLVKVLDGCALNDRFWVFSAATTNVQYTLTVTDSETGAEVFYTNPLGNAAAALTDTDALATCG